MIEYSAENIFDLEVQAIVNPVNCIGVMGAGLALQFKERFPINFKKYKKSCDNGQMRAGKMLVVLEKEQYIINFPTKIHWKEKSTIALIRSGLKGLSKVISNYKIESVAIPALGCGLGGLKPIKVFREIENYMERVDAKVFIMYPQGEKQ